MFEPPNACERASRQRVRRGRRVHRQFPQNGSTNGRQSQGRKTAPRSLLSGMLSHLPCASVSGSAARASMTLRGPRQPDWGHVSAVAYLSPCQPITMGKRPIGHFAGSSHVRFEQTMALWTTESEYTYTTNALTALHSCPQAGTDLGHAGASLGCVARTVLVCLADSS